MDLSDKCPLDFAKGVKIDMECLPFYFSKLLGFAITAGSVALKLPQIINIVSSKNVDGLSPVAFYSEVPMYITTVVYNMRQNYPFSSYGETFAILVQNFILVVLLWMYMKPKPTMNAIAGTCAVFAATGVISYYLPANLLFILPLTNLPILIWSRVLQILGNFKAKSTGQLSLLTTFLMFGGSIARVFTTIQEVGLDFSLLSGFIIGGALSGILVLQIVFYSYMQPAAKKGKKQQ